MISVDRLRVPLTPGGLGLAPALAILVVTLLLLKNITTRIYRYLRIRHIPGPRIAGWTRLWLLRQGLSGECHSRFADISEKYGPIAKIGPYHVLTSDPDLIRRMNAARSPYQRGEWYQVLKFDPEKENLGTCTPQKHFELRSKMAAGYTGKDVEGIEGIIDRQILKFVDFLREGYVKTNKVFDFGRKAQYFTLDVISEISYGQPFGFMTEDRDMFDYIRITEEQFGMLAGLSIYPGLIPLLQSRVLRALTSGKEEVYGFGKLMQFVVHLLLLSGDEVIDWLDGYRIAKEKAAERFGPDKKVQKDMLGSFVKHGLTQNEAESEILFQIVAGSDTTATAIRTTLLLILATPRVYNTMMAEIHALASGLGENEVVSDRLSRKMPYLQAVIKEGIRWYPPVTGLLSKRVPPEGDVWNGVKLPGGTNVACSVVGIQRSKEFWGEDAAEFRPERWLEVGPDRLKAMEATLMLTFGYGRWQCLGKELAFMELNKVFVELLRRFDLVVVNPTKPLSSVCASVFMQHEYWMKAYERK